MFVCTLMDLVRECHPPGPGMQWLEWVCSKMGGDLLSVFRVPFGLPQEPVLGVGGRDGCRATSICALCKKPQPEQHNKCTQAKNKEKCEMLLEKEKERALQDELWCQAVGLERTPDGRGVQCGATGSPFNILFVEHQFCKLCVWRMFMTLSRKISKRKTTYKHFCQPQLDSHGQYRATPVAMTRYMEKRIVACLEMMASNVLDKLPEYFTDERERLALQAFLRAHND